MKLRESGMPEEAYWETLLDVPLILDPVLASGRGDEFTTDDMIGIINKLTKKDYNDFYNRYVFGTEVPDYDSIFGYAGYKVEKKQATSPDYGFSLRPRNGGFTINGVNSAAARWFR